ncbi:MAG: hypothetical protein GY782_00065 [Gammaproteobacteria bacterium]|nr:hypothetical protein [Gammaproteobacteria bacterium]
MYWMRLVKIMVFFDKNSLFGIPILAAIGFFEIKSTLEKSGFIVRLKWCISPYMKIFITSKKQHFVVSPRRLGGTPKMTTQSFGIFPWEIKKHIIFMYFCN